MWDTLQDVARNITLFFDNGGEGHRKCPRCKGSGLLENPFTRLEKSVAHSNQPCWFCEGVGALPIAGLNGFVLARATSCLPAPGQYGQPRAQFLQPYHCKSGEKTCSFTRFKLATNLADMIHDFSSTSWLNYRKDLSPYIPNSSECQSNTKCQKVKTKENFSRHPMSQQRLHSHSRSSYMHPIFKSECSQYLSGIILDPPTYNNLQPNAMHVMLSNKSGKNIFSADGLRGGYTTSALYTSKASRGQVSKIANQQSEMDFFGWSISRIQSKMDHGSGANATCVFNTGRRRPLRKARNRVREKAEKEALERARGIMRTLRPCKNEPSLAECNRQSGDFEPLINMQWQEVAGSLQETRACGGQPISSFVAPQIACLTSVAVCGQSWFNGVIPGVFKALMPPFQKTVNVCTR